MENRRNLLGLYIGLIERLEVSPRKIHRWQVNGTLIKEIKAAFNQLPEGSRGGYYPWFLKNQWVLDGTLSAPGNPVDEMMMRAWQYVRGPTLDTREDITADMSTWPENKQACHLLCNLLLSDMHPAPNQDIWIYFGFCACRDEYEEGCLAALYKQLMAQCLFDELYAAYDSSTLIRLFDSRGFQMEREKIPHLEDVLTGSPQTFKSVWNLKQIVTLKDAAMILSVAVDYGFTNCENATQVLKLTELYRRFFNHHLADPIKLHDAAIGGKLFEYVGSLVTLNKKDKKTMQRLMKNPYPLVPSFPLA